MSYELEHNDVNLETFMNVTLKKNYFKPLN